ncbi:MAG: hypothetical protein IKT37_01510 [Clostridia bacterium]|nr:hypothetical protein [Clostridia bacterium]
MGKVMILLNDAKEFDSIESLTLFVKSIIDSLPYEIVCAAYLDNENNLMALVRLNGGTATNVDANAEDLIGYAHAILCKRVVIYHNHPSGSAVPSESDIVATRRLYKLTFVNGIKLLDHIVVSKNGYHSVLSDLPDIAL